MTKEELQNEYDFLIGEKLAKEMLEEKIINEKEFQNFLDCLADDCSYSLKKLIN